MWNSDQGMVGSVRGKNSELGRTLQIAVSEKDGETNVVLIYNEEK